MVAIHLTEGGAWSAHGERRWSGSAAVQETAGGGLRVANESTQGADGTVPLDFVDDELVLVGSRPVPTVDALTAVVDHAVRQVAVPGHHEGVSVSHPSHWGAVRVGRLQEAARPVCGRATTVPVAVAAANAVSGSAPAGRMRSAWIVVELSPTTTVVSYVAAVERSYRVLDVELDPNTGGSDLLGDGSVATAIASTVEAVGRGRRVDGVLVVGNLGDGDVASLDALGAAIGPSSIRLVPAHDIVRGLAGSDVPAGGADTVAPQITRTDWIRRSVDSDAPRPRRTLLSVAVGTAVAIALVAGGVLAWVGHDRGSTSDVLVAEPPPTETGTPPGSGAPSDTGVPPEPTVVPDVPVPSELVVGDVRLDVPAGWIERSSRRSAQASMSRVELAPEGATGRRIVVVRNELLPDADAGSVAAELAEKVASDGDGKFAEFDPEAMRGNRAGMSYREHPGDGSEVQWMVFLDGQVQLSIGCQHLEGEWPQLRADCEDVISSARVQP